MKTVLALLLLSISSYGIASTDRSVEEDRAVDIAMKTLAGSHKVVAADVRVVRVSRFNWPNSALGCPEPGVLYTQMIVPGYLVLLEHKGEVYRVHIGKDRGVICDLKKSPVKLEKKILENLKKMAVQDLAGKLNVEPAEIEISSYASRVWRGENLGCSSQPGPDQRRAVRGYLMELEYDGRIYQYRTSRTEVLPCPEIEMD